MLTKETLVGIVLSAARYPDVRGRKVLEGRNGRKGGNLSSSILPLLLLLLLLLILLLLWMDLLRRGMIIVDTCRIGPCVIIDWICLCVEFIRVYDIDGEDIVLMEVIINI